MSFFNVSNTSETPWKGYEKTALRFFFIYFVVQAVPLDWKFYQALFSFNWFQPNFYALFSLSRYAPVFFSLPGFANWGIALIIAVLGTIVWPLAIKRDVNYDNLLYWLRVILRYRLAIGVIAYGLIKIFPLQMPYPSLSNLHTNYGDFFPWKIYFNTIGVTQGYEVFLGLIEILAGSLLFFRRTVVFGAGIILAFTGNVFAANLGYDAGETVYSAYLAVIATFLFAYDAPRLFTLLITEKYTIAEQFKPVFATKNLRTVRVVLRSAFVLFVLLLASQTYANYADAPYKLPKTPGVKGSYGFYNVKEFRLNNQVIPYSATDTARWQNVVFEKWATISIKIAKPIIPDAGTGEGYHEKDIDRTFESAGVAGRRYYAYTADTLQHSLLLQNKNKNYPNEKLQLGYQFLNDSTIVLKGINERKDSVYAVLGKVNKKYLLFEGRRKPLKL